MATSLPSLFLGLFAGVVADHYDRKRLMVGACFVQAVFIGLIPLLIGTSVLWLYALVALSACARQFYTPAYESVLPETATDEELGAANSLMSISTVGSTALGYAAAGLLASRMDLDWVFVLDALTFVFAGVCLMGISARTLETEALTSFTGVMRNMRKGLGYLFGNRLLRAVLSIGLGIGLSAGIINTLTLPFTITVLGSTEAVFGLQEALTSVGFIVGSFMMARFSGRFSERHWVATSIAAMGAASLAYTFASFVPAAVFFFMLIGFFNAPAIIAIRLLFQRNTPAELRGRVIGAYFIGVEGAVVLGMGIGGLADILGIRVLLGFAALLALAIGLTAALLPGLKPAPPHLSRREA
jgi:MFS family permease